MEGDARGVGNVAEENVFKRRIRRLQDLRQERRAERLALAVDVGVVRAREVDALEGAGAGSLPDVRTEFGHQDFAFRGNDQRRAGREFLHRFRRDVERRLDGGALARHDRHVVVDVVEPRPDAVRVARGERPAVARHAAERPRAVGICQRIGERGGKGGPSQFAGDQFAQEVAVGLARGERAVLAVVLEQFGGIREVEVSGEEHRVGKFARLVDEWMAKRHLVFSEGGVAEVSEENALRRSGVEQGDSGLFMSLADCAQQVRQGRGRGRLEHPVGHVARFGMAGEDCRARAVLPAVVLFLQKQRELRPSKIARGGWWPSQDHHRHGAFVFQFIRHWQLTNHQPETRNPKLSRGTTCRGTWEAASGCRRPSFQACRPSCAAPASTRGSPPPRRCRTPPVRAPRRACGCSP